ncbi:GntR family transcriptional regulator [Paenibacillus solisilvae]|uniref:GntR family transcriptional regulator n=1 Tax=Paenibacillus solisilvae TaxID=2486751 RepID=A0ABW0W2A0_9BACL
MLKFNLTPIEKIFTTKERAYKEIKNVILNGGISPNEIFTEVKLAEVLNTSRTPVREALQDLIREGLILTVPRKGMKVRNVSKSEIEQIFLIRTSIESEVIIKLTKFITPKQIDELKEICLEQEEAMNQNDEVAFLNFDQSFHIAITKFVDYKLIEQVLHNLHNLYHLIGMRSVKKNNRMNEVLSEHRNIIHHLEMKNEELAAAAMRDHLIRTKESLNN